MGVGVSGCVSGFERGVVVFVRVRLRVFLIFGKRVMEKIKKARAIDTKAP